MFTEDISSAVGQKNLSLVLPNSIQMRNHVLSALTRYWQVDSSPIYKLPFHILKPDPSIILPLRLQSVLMPNWAGDCAVDGCILVPQEAVPSIQQKPEDVWKSVDWVLAAFLMLEGWHERLWEHQYGPIHSYSFHLQGWDHRVWQYAWVNRIGLFLRRWVGELGGREALAQLGDFPNPVIHMTHDVDAIRKTLPIRIKQSAFNLFNAVRALSQGKVHQSVLRIAQSIRFLIGQENWWVFDRLLAVEKQAGVQATWHFYADPRRKTFKRWLLDPGYGVKAPAQRRLLQQLRKAGHKIGLHPGFDTWLSPSQLAAARNELSQAAGFEVTHCRQHWLRFSWADTWHAQECAALSKDSTLMFNDRSGYRTSTALSWHPWSLSKNSEHQISALPTVIMDSHLYDYKPMRSLERQEAMRHWITECNIVGGEIAVLWHPHTLTVDYGWSSGFHQLLEIIKEV